MTHIPTRIIANRFMAASDDAPILEQDDTFAQDFHRVVTAEYDRLIKLINIRYCSDIAATDSPYPGYSDMHDSVTQDNLLKMQRYETFASVAPCDYSLFRLIHDTHHVLLNADFTAKSEAMLGEVMVHALSQHGASPLVRWFTRSIFVYGVAMIIENREEYLGNKIVLQDLLY
jgi:hypothetical protein